MEFREVTTFHQLRSLISAFLVDEEVSLPEIQQALGHKSLASTGVYLKVRDERTVARVLANAF